MTTSLSPRYGSNPKPNNHNHSGLHSVQSFVQQPTLHLVEPEGQLQIHTAAHRGSFSRVLSEALRAAGLGRRVMVAQFLKGGVSQGPDRSIQLCGRLDWVRPDIPALLTQNINDYRCKEKKISAIEAVQQVWEACKIRLLGKELDQLVLDEIGLAISLGYLKENDVIETLTQRPGSMDVILTGPSIPSRAISMADQVTELRCGH